LIMTMTWTKSRTPSKEIQTSKKLLTAYLDNDKDYAEEDEEELDDEDNYNQEDDY
jgi:hypothetical protein